MLGQSLDYSGKLILAPMVRVGTLPMRLMALKYGADLVYSPEIIDRRLIASERVINGMNSLIDTLEKLGTVDFIDANGTLNLRVHQSESKRLIVQLGTADPDNAIAAALKVYVLVGNDKRKRSKDVAGIDVNCGCPKRFSLVSSMGSALLQDPERLESILKGLVAKVPLPITCKIRLIPGTSDETFIARTIDFVKRMERTGISAIGVHCRFTHEKPRDPGHWEIFDHLSKIIKIPLIANGDIYSWDDISRIRQRLQNPSISFMLARGAQWNPSVFCKEGTKPIYDIVHEYIQIAEQYEMHYKNAKYTVLQMEIPGKIGVRFKTGIAQTKNYDELRHLLNETLYLEESDRVLKKLKQEAKTPTSCAFSSAEPEATLLT